MVYIPDLVSVVFILIAIVISFIIGKKSVKSYRESGNKQTLIFAFAAIFVASAMLFLVVEKLFVSIIVIETLGILFGGIATSLSGGAVISIDAFSFKMVFPKIAKILAAISIIVILGYVAIWLLDDTKFVLDGEIQFGVFLGIDQLTPTLAYFTLFPLLLIPVLVFFYFAIKVRKESSMKSKKAAGLGLGVLLLSTAYIVELLGVDPLFTAIIRVLFPIAGYILYWALFKVKAKEE